MPEKELFGWDGLHLSDKGAVVLRTFFCEEIDKALKGLLKLDIVSRRTISPDRTWLKRDIQSDIHHYKYEGPHSTFKEGSKVKSDPTKRFVAHDFP